MRTGAAIGSIVALAGSPAHADENDPFDGATVTVEACGGVLAGAVLGAGAGLLGAGIGQLISPRNWGVPLAGAALGVAIGGSIGMVAGIDYVGDDRGANGTVLGTSLGLAGGFIVLGAIQTVAAKADWNVPTSVNLLLGIVTLVGGPVIGYNLTADQDGGRVLVPIVGGLY